jgi:hypothetical protein
MPKNVMIYGSFVSRDAFGFLDSGFSLLRYVSGQSIISALSRPAVLLEGLTGVSPGGSLDNDIKSTLLKYVRRYAREIDVLVIDLSDERHGVVQLPDGTVVTHSRELADSGLLEALPGRKTMISPVSERHWMLWEASANRLFNALSELGLREKTLVLDAPWPEVSGPGDALGEYRDLETADVNAYFSECCAHVRSLGFTVATLPKELRLASERKRGSVPFRFASSPNFWLASQIATVATGAASV